MRTLPKISIRKKIIKIRAEVNYKIKTKKTTEKINEIKSWFFVKINQIGKPLAGLCKKTERERTRKKTCRYIKSELREEIITDTIKIKESSEIINTLCKLLYAPKIDNLKMMKNFLELYKHLRD